MQQDENLNEEIGTKRCPYCGEVIKSKAVKCRHCKTMLDNKLDYNTYNTDVYFNGKKELKLWKKIVIIYPVWKKYMLEEFILKDGILTVSTQSGKSIKAPLEKIVSTYLKDSKNGDRITIKIKTPSGDSISFTEGMWTVTDEEWEQIMAILQPKETGYSKTLGFISNILNWF